jgi:hypothetical protein
MLNVKHAKKKINKYEKNYSESQKLNTPDVVNKLIIYIKTIYS